ncbi:MAG: hypothetical protein ACI8PZ_007585 [Myxococcota bacterium]|jgi:hypothetical protein
MSRTRAALALLTFMHAGRAMTLAFLPAVGTAAAGAPPSAWAMPLLGDAVVGVTAPFAAWLAWSLFTDPRARVLLFTWHALGAWDAMSAWVVHRTVPWPEFFMVQLFGDSMFFGAAAMHLVALALIGLLSSTLATPAPST